MKEEPRLKRIPYGKSDFYLKPSVNENENAEEKIEALRLEAASQLNQYSLDEKFLETIGQTTLKKLILIFSGNRLVHHLEI